MALKKKKNLIDKILIGSMPLVWAGILFGHSCLDPPGFNKLRNEVVSIIGGDYAYNYFVRSLKKREEYKRYQAAERLGMLGRKDAVSHLKPVLEDPYEHPLVRSKAAVAIRRLMPNQYSKEKLDGSFIEDRDSLVSIIVKDLEALSHVIREKDKGYYEDIYDKHVVNYTENFNRLCEEKKLSIVELNVIKNVLDELKREETLLELGDLVNADLRFGDVELEGIGKEGNHNCFMVDASKTELGGLVKIVEKDGKKRIIFETYEPGALFDNGSYYGNESYKRDGAVCSFHLHAVEREGTPKLAGPSFMFGDLSSAACTSRDGIVITYIGTDENNRIQVNIDYYTRNWVIVDLGVYSTGVKLEEAVNEPIVVDFDAEIESD